MPSGILDFVRDAEEEIEVASRRPSQEVIASKQLSAFLKDAENEIRAVKPPAPTEQERVLGIARGALGQAPFPTIRGGVLAGGAALLSKVARGAGVLSGTIGDKRGAKIREEQADFWSRYSGALLRVVGERAEESGNIIPPIVKRGGASALATAPTMLIAAPLGPYGMIVGGALDEANSARTEGKDAGLRGTKLNTYVARQGAIEGTIAGAMQKVGLGGLEKVVGGRAAISNGIRQTLKQGRTVRGAVKGAIKDFGEEEVEEITTAVLQTINDKYSDVSEEDITLKSLASVAAETTSQVVWTMGGVSAFRIPTQVSEGKRAKAEKEIVDIAESGEAPTRKQWKKWGMALEKGKSARARKEGVSKIANLINAKAEALAEVSKTAREILTGVPAEKTVAEPRQAPAEIAKQALAEPVISPEQEIKEEVAPEVEGEFKKEATPISEEEFKANFRKTAKPAIRLESGEIVEAKPGQIHAKAFAKAQEQGLEIDNATVIGWTYKGKFVSKNELLGGEAAGRAGLTSEAIQGKPGYGKFPAQILAKRESWQPEGPAMPAIEALMQQAEEAKPKRKGFLKEEGAAAPLAGGPLGQRPRGDVVGGVAGGVDISVGRPEVDARLEAVRGVQKPTLHAKIGEGLKTAAHYVTRPHVHIPGTTKFSAAREVLRLLKAVPHSGKDSAIRIAAAVIDPMGPEQLKLFGRHAVIKNQLAALDLGQPLRFGFKDRAEVLAYKEKLDAIIEQTPEVKEAIKNRREAVREVCGAAVAFGLLPESALQNSETYFHQQVMMYHTASTKYAGGSLYQKTKKSFQKKRVAAEGLESLDAEYDYNTDYLQSEISWMSDALANVQQEQLLDKLLHVYNKHDKFAAEAKRRGISLSKIVRESGDMALWQPMPGNTYYRAFSISDKIAEKIQSGLIDSFDLTKEQIKTVLAVGANRQSAVLPKEIVAELEAARKPADSHWLTALNEGAIRAWKILSTIGPKRITAYELRNLTGDLEPVLAAHPEIVLEVKQAAIELRRMMKPTAVLTPEQLSARNLAVTSSGFFTSEIGKIGGLNVFAHLDKEGTRFLEKLKHPVKAYLDYVGPLNNFREDLLRYAALRFYRKALAKGELKHFGASKRAVVKQLQKDMGNEVAAAHMARELLGDYGNMTVAGEWARKKLYPFWSFQEINIKRWPRLTVNAFQSGEGRGKTGVAGATMATMYSCAALLRLAQGQAALYVWNNIMVPLIWDCDDEDDLPPNERANPHILLGRSADGSMRIFTNVGSSGDFLEWFGISEAISMIGKYKAGQVTGTDIIKEMMKSPLEKMVGSLRPDVKGGFEILTGQSLFPSPFTPRAVARGEAAAGIVGMRDEYKWVKGMCLGDGTRPRRNYWQRVLWRTLNPKAMALSEIYDLRGRFLDKKGSPGKGIFPISEYKTAREAAINENYDAFVEWKGKFQERHPHDAAKRFRSFLIRMDPIASRLNEADEREFVLEYLTNEQRDKLKVAQDYASELQAVLVTWWEAAEKTGNIPVN